MKHLEVAGVLDTGDIKRKFSIRIPVDGELTDSDADVLAQVIRKFIKRQIKQGAFKTHNS